MTRIDDPHKSLDLLLMREVLKTAHLFGDAQGHAGMAQDAFVDVIAEAVVAAADRGSSGRTPPAEHRSVAARAALHAHKHGGNEGVLGAVVEGPARVSSAFGERVDPITHRHSHHHGLDIAAPAGTPITSIMSGTVTHAGPAGGYGLLVEVKADDGTVSRYAHADRVDVNVGDRVDVGDSIATVGSTGRSTGPHLHLEVRKDGQAVDPTTALLAAGRASVR